MSFIKTYGIAFPQFIIADNLLHPKGRKINHAIAYVDEDIITLAYQAASDAIRNPKIETKNIQAVFFATNTPVFKHRYHASYLAELLGLPEGITALDMGTTNRAGTDALLIADTLVNSGKYKNILIVAADINFPSIGEETKSPFGHAAVAMILSKDSGVAEITHASSHSAAVAEAFLYKGEKVQYDARFARSAGFKDNMKYVLNQMDPSAIDSLIVNSAYVKLILGDLKKAGFNIENQMTPDTLVPQHGYTGSAHGLLRLVNAIETQKGTSVLVDYNNGSNVIKINVPKPLGSTSDDLITKKTAIASYQDYLTLCKQGKFEGGGYQTTEMFSSEMMQRRERDQLIHLKGSVCKSCNTIYFMKAARCNHCKGTTFGEMQLSKTGTVYTQTSEYYFPASFPPINMIVIDLDGGGRITVQQTDDMYQNEQTSLQIGDKVALVLRKIMETGAKPDYFWKCRKL